MGAFEISEVRRFELFCERQTRRLRQRPRRYKRKHRASDDGDLVVVADPTELSDRWGNDIITIRK